MSISNHLSIDMVQPVNRLCSLNRGLVMWLLGVPGTMGGSRFIDLCNPGPGGNHGTLINAPSFVGDPQGMIGGDFNGSDQYIQTSYTTIHSTTTFATWLYMKSFSGNRVVWKTSSFNISASVGGILIEHEFSGTDPSFNVTMDPYVDKWTHVVVSWDVTSTANMPSAVINGVPQVVNIGVLPTGTASTSGDPWVFAGREIA